LFLWHDQKEQKKRPSRLTGMAFYRYGQKYLNPISGS